MEQITYTQEQLNVVAGTYDKKLGAYMQELVNKELQILSLRRKVQELTKENIELKKPKEETKK